MKIINIYLYLYNLNILLIIIKIFKYGIVKLIKKQVIKNKYLNSCIFIDMSYYSYLM